jgi:hypothetical protein
MPNLHQLSLTDRHLICDLLTQHPPGISELTFTNLFIWRNSRPIWFALPDNSLLLFLKASGDDDRLILLGQPVGDILLSEVFAHFGNRLAGAIRLPEHVVQTLQHNSSLVIDDRDNADYVYRVADLAELAGRRYAKKRNKIKQCLQNHSCLYEPITRTNLVECMEMQARWCEARECGHLPGLCSENMAIDELFENFWELDGLIGGAIRVNGTIQAYALGEQLHPGTAVCHFEKAMPTIPGLGQLINQWYARYSLQPFEFINREQDLGISGLRQAKESYFPHHLVKKYTVFLDKPFEQEPARTGRCASEEE